MRPLRRRAWLTPVAMLPALLAPVAADAAAPAHAVPVRFAPTLAWQEVGTGTAEQYRGLDVVSRRIVWVGSNQGTVRRTLDGGRTWPDVSPPAGPGSDGTPLQFRDVAGFDARTAVVMSAGVGTDSQIWRTGNGGRTWRRTFTNTAADGFYDCMAFWDRRHGIAVGDPVDRQGTATGADKRWEVQRTADGGRTWHTLGWRNRPVATPGEAGFAASGTCVAVAGGRYAWLATGAATEGGARVLRSSDRGRTWAAVRTSVPAGPQGAGLFSVAFRTPRLGVAVGGDFSAPGTAPDSAIRSWNRGRTWTPAARSISGYRSGVAWLPWWPWGAVAVGPTGSDVTWDAGRTWHPLSGTGPAGKGLDAVDCARGACFGSGTAGRVARLVLRWR